MSENKYEQRVRQRAEEMAHIYKENKNRRLVDIFEAAARLSVQREAEAYESAYRQLSELRGWKTTKIEAHITEQLQSLGLVPENDKPCGT